MVLTDSGGNCRHPQNCLNKFDAGFNRQSLNFKERVTVFTYNKCHLNLGPLNHVGIIGENEH